MKKEQPDKSSDVKKNLALEATDNLGSRDFRKVMKYNLKMQKERE